MTDTNREQKLQELARQNARWADLELGLIETIRENKRQLEQLPGIIRFLNKQLGHVTAEMKRSASEHDALEAEGEDAEFHAWANDMDDDYADHKLAVQPPVGW